MLTRLRNLLPKLTLPGVLLLALGTSWAAFDFPYFKKQPSSQDLHRVSNKIHDTLLPLYTKSEEFEKTAIFLYSSDYKERVFLYSHHVKIDTNIISYSTHGDPAFESALEFHKEGLCYIANSTNLTTDSLMYTVISNWEGITIDVSVYYISCPLFIDGNLSGYIGNVVDIKSREHGLIEDVQLIKFLAKKVEGELEALF